MANLPNIRNYWIIEPLLQMPWYTTVMLQRKFLLLILYIHFADNSTALSYNDSSFDRLWKIRSAIEVIRQHCKEVYSPGFCVSVNESMIRTRGRLSFLQYLPKNLLNGS